MARYRVLRLMRADGTTVREKGLDGKEREVPDVITKTLEHDWNPGLGDQLDEEFIMKDLQSVLARDGRVFQFVVKSKDGDTDDRGGKDRDPGGEAGDGSADDGDDEDDYSGPEDALKPMILTAYDAWKAYKKGEQPDVEAPAWCKPLSPQETPAQFARRAAGEFAKLPAAKAAMESVGSGVDWEDWVTAGMRYEHHEAVAGAKGGKDQGVGSDRGQKGNGGADAGDSVEKGMAAFDLVERLEGEVAKSVDVDLSDALSGLDLLAKGGPAEAVVSQVVPVRAGRVEKSLDADSMAGMAGLQELASGTPVAVPAGDLRSDLAKDGPGLAALEGFATEDADPHELAMGVAHEMEEHGYAAAEAERVALDHLSERPDYYSHLQHEEAETPAQEAAEHKVPVARSEFCPVCLLGSADCACDDETLSAAAEQAGTQEVAVEVPASEDLGHLIGSK